MKGEVNMETMKLNNNLECPVIGIGTFHQPGGKLISGEHHSVLSGANSFYKSDYNML